jgi:hypothetical protein
MRLQKIGGCDDGTCPALYLTDGGTVVVQGAVVTDTEALAALDLPGHETAVEVPLSLFATAKVEP